MEPEKRNTVYKSIMLVLVTTLIVFMVTTIIMYNYFVNTNSGRMTVLQKQAGDANIKQTLYERMQVLKNELEKRYIGEINEEDMLQSALKGYVEGLNDEYTEYLTQEEYDELMVSVTGDFVGIGVYISKNTDGNIIVVLPIEDSPAEEAGLEIGDIILKVNGEDCSSMELDAVSAKIQGESGTKVKLEISRDGKTFEKEIERREVVIKDSYSEVLKGNIGYIQLVTFDEKSYQNVKKYVDEFKAKGINKVILDLRDNTGGIVVDAIDICEIFIPKDGIIMKTYNKTQNETLVKSENKEQNNMKLVLLVNELSASASEIVTAALKDNGVATVIGTKTYGKGVMQEIVPIKGKEFKGAIKMTTEEFFTPNGDKINGIGIEPHIVIEDDPETKEDEQLERAIQELNK